MTAIERANQQYGPATHATPVGLELADGISFDEWADVGRRIISVNNATTWAIADWLHEGEWRYGQGSIYDEAMRITGYERQTLMNIALVAGKFNFSRRRENLSFSHHAEVIGLSISEQDAWLQRAESEGWPRNELRDRIRASRQLPVRSQAITPLRLTFAVEPDREQRWRTAAEREGLPLHEWAANTLDAAA